MTIGLTGGIAAGKSAVRKLLESSTGAEFFDADQCVHELLESDQAVATGIAQALGAQYLRPLDGRPDRAALRELVFSQPEARRKLETLLHPAVRARWQAQRRNCLASGRDYVADIPLIYETAAEESFDCIVVVACSGVIQMERLRKRGLSAQTAQGMLASQLPLMQKMSRASFVVWNDGSLAALARQIKLLVQQLIPA